MMGSPQPAPWIRKKIFLGAGSAVAVVAAFVVFLSPSPQSRVHNGIPLPFGSAESSLAGKVTFVGQRNGIDVYEVTYRNSETFELLQPDRIYLVHVPNLPEVIDAPIDVAMAAATGTGRGINYYGYRYSDAAATFERRDIRAVLFKDRFPGQFFASAKARAEDASHGNQLLAFEQSNGITFLKTDGTAGSVRMDPAGALYVFVVNEAGGARLFARSGGVCGNAILEPGEDCDDADTDDNNACTNTCRNGIPIPFGSGSTATGTKLALSVQTTAASATVQPSQTGVTLLRFDAGSTEAVRLQRIVVTAQTGSLSHAVNYRLMKDANGDGTVDTVLQSGVTPVSGLLTFDALNGTAGETVVPATPRSYAVVADIAGTAAGKVLQLRLASTQSDYVGGRRESPAVPLAGIRTDTVCSVSVCQIAVTLRPSIFLTVANPPVCGNGVVQLGEICDDGDIQSGDGCSSVCAVEQGYTCTGSPSVCTQDPVTGSAADLIIVAANLPATGTGFPLEAKTLVRFTATASGESVDLEAVRIRAVTGSGTAMASFQIKKDTNGDGITDTVLPSAFTRQGVSDVVITLSGAHVIAVGSDVVFEVTGAFVDTPQEPVKFVFASTNTPFATSQTYIEASMTGGDTLAGLETDGACPATCMIHVTTGITTLWTQVDLHGSAPECGDNVCDSSEQFPDMQCGQGVCQNPDYCPSDCVSAVCGNGDIEGSETCDDNGTQSGDGCSSVCAVEQGYTCTGEPSICAPASSDPLAITVLPLASSGQTVPGAENLTLLRFRASAGANPVLLKSVMFGAQTGSLATLGGTPSLWRDTDNDGIADTKVLDKSVNSTSTVLVFFDAAVAQNRVIAAGQSAVFEVRSDIASSAQPPVDFSLMFKTDLANFVGAVNQTTDENLSGIQTDGLCLFTCEINVLTRASTLWRVRAPAAVCGNGDIEGSETCDDNGTQSGDGCSSVCAVEQGYTCTGEPSVCAPEDLCGNGQIDGNEECDDGNQIDTDDCDNSCRLTTPLPDF